MAIAFFLLVATLALPECTKTTKITEVLRKKLASDTFVVVCVEAKISNANFPIRFVVTIFSLCVYCIYILLVI